MENGEVQKKEKILEKFRKLQLEKCDEDEHLIKLFVSF